MNVNDKALITEIMNAYHDGKIDWANVPSMQILIQQEVHRQVAEQVKDLAIRTEQPYADQLSVWTVKQQRAYQASQAQIKKWQNDLDATQQPIFVNARQQLLAVIVQVVGIVALIFTLVALCWLVVPLIIHGTGLAYIWHALAPSVSWWGVLRFVLALIGMALLIVLEIVLVAVPTFFVSRVYTWLSEKCHPFKNYRQKYY